MASIQTDGIGPQIRFYVEGYVLVTSTRSQATINVGVSIRDGDGESIPLTERDPSGVELAAVELMEAGLKAKREWWDRQGVEATPYRVK